MPRTVENFSLKKKKNAKGGVKGLLNNKELSKVRSTNFLNRRRKKPHLKEAYDQVWPIIKKAGTRLYRLGYQEQSGKLKALFQELDN